MRSRSSCRPLTWSRAVKSRPSWPTCSPSTSAPKSPCTSLGEPIETMDGELLAMSEPHTVTATLARLHITEEKTDDDRTD